MIGPSDSPIFSRSKNGFSHKPPHPLSAAEMRQIGCEYLKMVLANPTHVDDRSEGTGITTVTILYFTFKNK